MIDEIAAVHYRPHDDAYGLDVEVIDAEELRRRVASNPARGFERVDFQCVLYVRSGNYTHAVDFETYRCSPRSCVLIGPGQVHRFGSERNWDGWMIIVAPQHVPNAIDRLPSHIRIGGESEVATVELFERMASDASSASDPVQLNELLALQAQLMVHRLVLGHVSQGSAQLIDPVAIGRYREYRSAVDTHFRQCHLVSTYAKHLGYSTKSLNRTCRAAGDVSAKRVIVERIILEAKRLLAHSTDPAAAISADLGFDEPTNFVKFFKRETGLTPTGFRSSLTPAHPSNLSTRW